MEFSGLSFCSLLEECCRLILLSLLDRRSASLLMRPSLLLRLGRSRRLSDFCVSSCLELVFLTLLSFVDDREDLARLMADRLLSLLLGCFPPDFGMGSKEGGVSPSSDSSVEPLLLL